MSLPTIIKTGEFNLMGTIVRCHVLSDGQRVIDEESLATIFSDKSKPLKEGDDLEAFCRWIKEL